MKDFSKIDIRDALFDEIYNIASRDKNVIFITADTDAFSLHKFKKDFPNQYINTGVSEQSMILASAGLAMSGKKVYMYALIPFITIRCYEFIKVNICSMNLPITLIGAGAGFSFGFDGPTHHAICDISVMRTLPELHIYNPSDGLSAYLCARESYKDSNPSYVRIDKGFYPSIYNNTNWNNGFYSVKRGRDICIISTGIFVHKALQIANDFKKYNIDVEVIDLYRIKPINEKSFINKLSSFQYIFTLEENSIIGGIGSIISEIIIDNSLDIKLKRFAIKDEQCFYYGSRDYLHKKYNLDNETILKEIIRFGR